LRTTVTIAERADFAAHGSQDRHSGRRLSRTGEACDDGSEEKRVRMEKVELLGGRTLAGRFIALEPLETRHHAGLIAAARDVDIFTYMPFDISQGFAARLDGFTSENASGRMISYAVRRLVDGAIVGSTSYLNIAPGDAQGRNRSTWYAPEAQASAVNPEAKYLLLENAFTRTGTAFEFKTDSKNARSRAALTKLGAKEEGILRGHMWMPQGYFGIRCILDPGERMGGGEGGLEERLAAFD